MILKDDPTELMTDFEMKLEKEAKRERVSVRRTYSQKMPESVSWIGK